MSENLSSPLDSDKNSITRAFIQEDYLVLELQERDIRSKADANDFDKTIQILRDHLDSEIDDIELKEKIFLIRKGLILGINLIKYDRSVIPYAHHITDPDTQIKLLLDRSKRLIEKARSKK